jgi:predicted amidohydrolase
MDFRVALAQIDPVLGDLRKNSDLHVEMASRALEEKAAVIVFPELSLTGYSVKDMNFELALRTKSPPGDLSALLRISSRISIIAGGIEEDHSHRVYNAAFLIEDGRITTVHRKVYLPTYGMFEEFRYFSPGRSVRTFPSKVGVLGALICEDLWHVSLPYLLAQQGTPVIVGLVASPTRMAGEQKELPIAVANAENHRAYARLLSLYILFCNRVGFEDGVNFWGGSEIVAPGGTTVAKGRLFEADIVVGDITENTLRRSRQSSRHSLDEDPRLVLQELRRLQD